HTLLSSPTPCSSTIVGLADDAAALMALLLGAQCCQTLLWASTGRASECNQNFICVRCIRNSAFEGLVVGANRSIREVLQRNIEDDACGAALFYCWQQCGGVCCIAEVVSELK